MSIHPPARQDRFLDVQIVLGQDTIVPADPVARVAILLKISPVADPKSTDTPMDYRLVIDRSTSMGEGIGFNSHMSRLDATKQALSGFVSSLGARDSAMLCSFWDQYEVNAPLNRMDAAHTRRIQREISAMYPQGSTHISDAVRAALEPHPTRGMPSRLILLTDGQSQTRVQQDHAQLAELADRSRQLGIPWLIYGTGDDYNWELLQQLQARVGHGSFCKNVLNLAALESHLLGELAFHRGVAIEGLEVNGLAQCGTINSVTRFCPEQMNLPDRRLADPNQRPRDFFQDDKFRDAIGSLDHFRGQQLLIEIDVPRADLGKLDLIEFTIKGSLLSRGLLHFTEKFSASVNITGDSSKVPPFNAEILRVYQEMAAKRAADQGNYKRARALYTATGNLRAATDMQTMEQMTADGVSREAVRREAHTMTAGFTSMAYTRGGSSDSDSRP